MWSKKHLRRLLGGRELLNDPETFSPDLHPVSVFATLLSVELELLFDRGNGVRMLKHYKG